MPLHVFIGWNNAAKFQTSAQLGSEKNIIYHPDKGQCNNHLQERPATSQKPG
jgi:hypothetical protein